MQGFVRARTVAAGAASAAAAPTASSAAAAKPVVTQSAAASSGTATETAVAAAAVAAAATAATSSSSGSKTAASKSRALNVPLTATTTGRSADTTAAVASTGSKAAAVRSKPGATTAAPALKAANAGGTAAATVQQVQSSASGSSSSSKRARSVSDASGMSVESGEVVLSDAGSSTATGAQPAETVMSETVARPVTATLATAEPATRAVAATTVTAKAAPKPAATLVPRASDAPQQKWFVLALNLPLQLYGDIMSTAVVQLHIWLSASLISGCRMSTPYVCALSLTQQLQQQQQQQAPQAVAVVPVQVPVAAVAAAVASKCNDLKLEYPPNTSATSVVKLSLDEVTAETLTFIRVLDLAHCTLDSAASSATCRKQSTLVAETISSLKKESSCTNDCTDSCHVLLLHAAATCTVCALTHLQLQELLCETFEDVGDYTVVGRCYERHILDVVFERYREADVAVEECEHQLQDLNMVSVRTQRPFKLLFKPHNFSGGSYIGEANASASTTSAAASSTAKVIDTATELLFLQTASTAQSENLNCMRIFNVDSDELEATILRACDRIGTYTQLGRNHARKTMDIQFARPRDAVAAADDLQYMFAIISSSRSSKTRPCKVLLKPRSFAGFGAATS
eukprot:12665-Heterococcus_DN1.PRE.1